MDKKVWKNILIAFILFLIAFFICMQTSFAPSGKYVANADSAIYKYIGFSITKGQTPYIDTYDNKRTSILLFKCVGRTD